MALSYDDLPDVRKPQMLRYCDGQSGGLTQKLLRLGLWQILKMLILIDPYDVEIRLP